MRSDPPCGGGDDWREELEWLCHAMGFREREEEDSRGVGENGLEGKIWIGFGSDGLNSVLGPVEIWALGSICE